MKNFCLFLLMSLVLMACGHDDFIGSLDTVSAPRNAKASQLNGQANSDHENSVAASLAGATADAALSNGASQFLGTWKVIGQGEETKGWDEETQGKTPWATFKSDGTMDGDGTYFPDDNFYFVNNDVIMFANGSTQIYAIITVQDLKLYTMELIYKGGPLKEDEELKLWMQKVQ